MRFLAHYIQQKPVENKRLDYWRTVDADSLPEADYLARRYQRRGYMIGLVIQEEYAA